MKSIKWTPETLRELCKQYKGPSELKKAHAGAYKALRQRGLVQECYPIADRQRNQPFTREALIELAKPYATRSQFQKAQPSAYNAARALGLIPQLIPTCLNEKKWDEITLAVEAKKHKTRSAFYDTAPGAYSIAVKKGIIDQICPPALQGTSTGELELLAFLQTLIPDFKTKRFGNDYEIDCYSESRKLGIEYNGLYWHSEDKKSPKYHIDKTKYFESIGIRIIHIWETEWKNRQQQVKNYLTSACGVNTVRLGARKCEFKEMDDKIARKFLNDAHIQGAPNSIKLAIGCYYEDLLISVATFGPHHRKGTAEWVLNRFACLPSHTVSGGLAKVSKMAFGILGPLKSWADYSKSQARGYVAAGWVLEDTLKPDYFYGDAQGNLISKQSRMKSRVGTSKEETEKAHAKRDGLYRIWDCGKIVLTYKAI